MSTIPVTGELDQRAVELAKLLTLLSDCPVSWISALRNGVEQELCSRQDRPALRLVPSAPEPF